MSLLAELELARPAGLAALVLPLALVLLSLRPRRPEVLATGTLVLWRSLAGAGQGARRGRHVPLSRWLLVLSLVSGALALAGPRPAREDAVRTWRVVVDRSPSCHLPALDSIGTRLDAASRALAEWVAGRPEDTRLVLVDGAGVLPPLELAQGEARLPVEWLERPSRALAELEPERWDRPGFLLLTDVLPRDPVHAGALVVGARPVPGPVAERPGERLVLGEDGVLSVEPASPRPVRASDLPPVLRELFELWAAERGLVPADGPTGRVALAVEVPPAGEEPVPLAASRSGWELSGRGRPLDLAPREDAWLTDGEGRVLVAAAPGRIRVALDELEEPGGDPVALALDWVELLDGCLAASPEVVSLGERLLEGEARIVEPSVEPMPAAPVRLWGQAILTPEVLLAAACALLAVLARLLRGA